MKYVSLFAGIGGFDLALNRLGHECVYANDFDKYCKITYDKNFCNQSKSEDIGKSLQNGGYSSSIAGEQGRNIKQVCLDTTPIGEVPAESIPDHDLLVGGFPCQAFSIAGKRKGFDDTRGTLFFEIARILAKKQPRYFLLENVKGLLSHDNGDTFKTIISTLVELGYDLQWQVLNSKNFGVPQNRERVFIVGHLRGTSRPKVFPIGSGYEEYLRETDEQRCSTTLTRRNAGGQNRRGNYVVGTLRTHKDGQGFREVKSGLSPTIPARAREDGSGQPVIRYPLKFLQRNQRNIEGDYSFTIDGANTGGVKEGMKIRRLTPIECERLQGFPDNWTQGVSDTQRYKQLGNAVTVNVVEHIARFLTPQGKY